MSNKQREKCNECSNVVL